jgi:hypothetical protein
LHFSTSVLGAITWLLGIETDDGTHVGVEITLTGVVGVGVYETGEAITETGTEAGMLDHSTTAKLDCDGTNVNETVSEFNKLAGTMYGELNCLVTECGTTVVDVTKVVGTVIVLVDGVLGGVGDLMLLTTALQNEVYDPSTRICWVVS